VWREFEGVNDEALAFRLLTTGVSVCAHDGLGVDDDGRKNYRDIALCIGRCLDQKKGKLALKVGGWGARMLVTSLPTLFAFDDDCVLTLLLTDDLDDFLTDVVECAAKTSPYLFPFATPPAPWTQYWRGGVPAGHWARVPLISERHPAIEGAVRDAIGKGRMDDVLDAINSMQNVPFTINKAMVDYFRREPEEPIPDAPDPESSPGKQWLAKQKRNEAIARRKARQMDLAIAERLAHRGRFYASLNMDFRGRLYGIPHFNFARDDRVRSLFLFADGMPIGEEGLIYLKAHVAAHADGIAWGAFLKPSSFNFEHRVAWTDYHIPLLREMVDAVLRGQTIPPTSLPKKEPFQFLAACVELVQAIDEGPGFITRLPLTFDGSCSGLQHLCAMTRAEEGRLVNLVEAYPPEDFYERVAERVWSFHPDLQHLMAGPCDRAIVKRPGMTYFYGSAAGGFTKKGRPYGMTEQVCEVLKERKRTTKDAHVLARAIFEAIEGMVPRAKEVRDYLQQLAALCASENKPLRWTTPLGLPVHSRYHEPEIEIIRTPLKGGRSRRTKLVVGDKKKVLKRKAVNAAAANFVHSVDAAHLQLVALAAAKEGIPMASVHDCFGCLAPHAQRLNEIIRQQFVRLHKRNNPLADVWASAKRDLSATGRKKLPLPPKIGDLDLDRVLNSYHAFA
jgi:DNA-directed RNA polymerase